MSADHTFIFEFSNYSDSPKVSIYENPRANLAITSDTVRLMMAALREAKDSITGGCLCEAVRYTIDFPAGSTWPPQSLHTFLMPFLKSGLSSMQQSHICQCTQCRKHSGSLMANFITVKPSQLCWSNPSGANKAAEPYKEFSSSKGVYRGFCSSCGTAFSWRSEETPDELEILIGTIDEKWLIGDRTQQVSSQSLTNPGSFEKVLNADEGALGRDICTPQAGQMYVRNAIKGATDMRLAGTRFVEVSQAKMEIPD
ncbi:MAG: hypothetical protein Q9225_002005 [Loekoesia sp. 1 TL-2023]